MNDDLIKALKDTLARPSCQFLRIDREAASRLLAVLEAPAEGAGEVADRFEKYLTERARSRQLDQEDIHGMHIGDAREVILTVADLRTAIIALRARSSAPEAREGDAVGLDEAQRKAVDRAAMDAGAYSWRNSRLAMVEGDKIIGYPAFSRADMAELARLNDTTAAPSADKLRTALQSVQRMAGNSSFNINQNGVTPETGELMRVFEDIERTALAALKAEV